MNQPFPPFSKDMCPKCIQLCKLIWHEHDWVMFAPTPARRRERFDRIDQLEAQQEACEKNGHK